jgi:hypothetical protein
VATKPLPTPPTPILHAEVCQQLAAAGLQELRVMPDQGRAYYIQRQEDVLSALKHYLEKEGQKPAWFEWTRWNMIVFGGWPK